MPFLTKRDNALLPFRMLRPDSFCRRQAPAGRGDKYGLHGSRSAAHQFLGLARKVAVKVMPENETKAHEQMGVEAFPAENVVHICPLASQLAGQPHGCLFSSNHFPLNALPEEQ